ncbi:UDP-N-acetylglucosamine 4,6-dehydratase family protein [Rossellomorea sp. KS-H15a]|uniref:UDP-N-acetylglucosamine 4,6-dehydratase family protein n=1 Tax=Rossellomorea sp. KS-H15a TaxID=2963940 RepID=UPI0020C5E242|nr:UDP-N-acetylglucosamine 4,6-dehydratase family protein [Rossellomorea sp. KS-H15a]UTE77498.1 polysaccharide biosynthesis protein [Rossellomorea sp. KS-H15a]
MNNIFENKNVIVTGGTGSIGSEIVSQVLSYNPKTLRVYSRDESKQFFLSQKYREFNNVRFLIGDVRDKNRLEYAFEDIDIVFHAAALKHVPACEYNPFEAVNTNVVGTQNVIEAALKNNVEKVVAISTDKVVNPTNTMGATKLLGERLISSANRYKGNKKTIFSCVRFGNVMGSRGSVIPLFVNQIMSAKPITITEPEMTRFFMSIPQATNLVLRAAELAHGGETFILKMPVMKIEDLAYSVMDIVTKKLSINRTSIEYIGKRAGEKLFEELMSEDEARNAYESKEMFVINPKCENSKELTYSNMNFLQTNRTKYSSKDEVMYNKNEINDLVSPVIDSIIKSGF